MGNQSVSKFADPLERRAFTKHLLNDIKALEYMLEHKMFESGKIRIGAEQELVIVDDQWRPAMNNLEIIAATNDDHVVTEIAKFNLEINLDPYVFSGDALTSMHRQLDELLLKVRKAAKEKGTKVVLTGILPTIQKKDLHFANMTPNPRYEALNEIIAGQKGSEFELYIVGVDELITRHPNILFEACNTSYQVHLQVEADEFTDRYNWSQLIAGPVLALSANSPVLMGRRLWSETRIALFQQSVDSRNATHLQRDKEPRVGFGREWLRGSAADLFKDNVSRYNLLFASDVGEDSLERVKAGEVPQLDALKLHNGTVFRWNRACYGISEGMPHLRIENRYIPSGPTTIDEMANAAFWLGLMENIPDSYANFTERMSFEDVRMNFYNAARVCMDSRFRWFGETVDATELLLDELLPLAIGGLEKHKVDGADIERYMNVVEGRLKTKQNGSKWSLNRLSHYLKGSTSNEASRNLTQDLYDNEQKGQPVHTWNVDLKIGSLQKAYDTVSQFMTTDLFTVSEDELVDLVISVMDWKNVPFIPVENDQHELVGMVTYKNLLHYFTAYSSSDDVSVKDIMVREFETCEPSCSTEEAVRIMAEHRVRCLPVIQDKKLIGIITEGDVLRVAYKTKKFTDGRN